MRADHGVGDALRTSPRFVKEIAPPATGHASAPSGGRAGRDLGRDHGRRSESRRTRTARLRIEQPRPGGGRQRLRPFRPTVANRSTKPKVTGFESCRARFAREAAFGVHGAKRCVQPASNEPSGQIDPNRPLCLAGTHRPTPLTRNTHLLSQLLDLAVGETVVQRWKSTPGDESRIGLTIDSNRGDERAQTRALAIRGESGFAAASSASFREIEDGDRLVQPRSPHSLYLDGHSYEATAREARMRHQDRRQRPPTRQAQGGSTFGVPRGSA